MGQLYSWFHVGAFFSGPNILKMQLFPLGTTKVGFNLYKQMQINSVPLSLKEIQFHIFSPLELYSLCLFNCRRCLLIIAYKKSK